MSDLESSTVSVEIERAYIKKLMVRLVPFLAILYLFCLLDRNNVAIAALTMQTDLQFNAKVYGMGFGIFFIGYFIFEIPSNLIMERVGARRWIARIMLTWGLVSSALMFVRTPMSFYALRFLLGVAEAGFYPGIILYLTYWIPANIRARVISRFLALTALLGLFGPVLGGQLLKLNGWHGLAGWQWLFLLEGIPSILLGFLVLVVLPDTPGHAKWLSIEEKEWISARLAREAKTTERVEHLSWREALRDPHILCLCVIFILTSTGGNAVGSIAPQLIKSRSSGLWSDPFVATVGIIPAIVGAIAMMLAAGHSDRTGKRRRHIVLGYFLAGLSYLLCVFTPTAWGIVFALSINALGERVAAGSYWAVTTSALGARAAAGGIAFINSVGNLGGFFGPYIMGELKQRNNGDYTAGLVFSAGLIMLTALMAIRMLRPSPPEAAPFMEPV